MEERALTDEELVSRFLSGSSEGFNALVERYEAKVFNTALHLTNDVEAAEEVLAEVFNALFEKIRSDFGRTPLFSWLIQFTLEAALEKLLSAPKPESDTRVIMLDQPFSVHQARFDEKHAAMRAALRAALCSLRGDLRYVFVLRDINGMSLKEVANLLDITIFEARAYLHRARLLLKRELEKLLVLNSSPVPVAL